MRRSKGLPCGMTMVSEQFLGNRSLIKLGGWSGEDAI